MWLSGKSLQRIEKSETYDSGLSSKWLPLLHGPSDGSGRTVGSLNEKSISSVIGLFEMIHPKAI
jgi:hypothetical protein